MVAPAQAINNLRCQYPELFICEEPPERRGLYAAINFAVESFSENCEWFTWLNDDDYFEEGFNKLLAIAKNLQAYDLVYGNVQFVDSKNKPMFDIPLARSENLLGACIKTGQIPFTQQGTLLRVSTFKQLGGFRSDLRLTADTEIFARMLRSGARARHINELVASYRLHHGQLSTDEVLQKSEHATVFKIKPRIGNLIWRMVVRFLFLASNSRQLFVRCFRYGFKSIREIMREIPST